MGQLRARAIAQHKAGDFPWGQFLAPGTQEGLGVVLERGCGALGGARGLVAPLRCGQADGRHSCSAALILPLMEPGGLFQPTAPEILVAFNLPG